MILLKGGKVNPAESFVYSKILELLELLRIGIPYSSIMEMPQEEINKIIGVNSALQEIYSESIQNAR